MADYSKTKTFSLRVGQTADNTDVLGLIVPAGREVEIQAMDVYVPTGGSTASSYLELVNEANTIQCRVAVSAEGHSGCIQAASTSAQTLPLKIAAQSTTAKTMLKIRVDGTLGAGNINFVNLKISGLD